MTTRLSAVLVLRAPDARVLHAPGGCRSAGDRQSDLHGRARRDAARGGERKSRRWRTRRGGFPALDHQREGGSGEGARVLDDSALPRLRVGGAQGPGWQPRAGGGGRLSRAGRVRSPAEADPGPSFGRQVPAGRRRELRQAAPGGPAGRVAVTIYDLREVEHVYAGRAGPVHAVCGVSLAVARGERVALLGPSGAGKSTLLRLLNATLRPAKGALSFEGRELSALSGRELRQVRRRIGTIFQNAALVPSLSALQNALCGRLGSWGFLRSLRALAAPTAEDVRAGRAALETVGLSGKQDARADEPFASLDPALTTQLADLLLAVTQGRTFVAAMHDVDLALERFPRIVGVRAGRIVFDVPAAEVSQGRLQELYAREARRAG